MSFICPAPWRSTCVTTSGHFRVCSESQSSRTKGIVKNDSSENLNIRNVSDVSALMNADSLKILRLKMLQNKDVSDTCQRCISEEKHGLLSARQQALGLYAEFTPESARQSVDESGSLVKDIELQNIIFRLGNKCNLTCRMCGPSSSSAWYQEWKQTRFSGFQEDGLRIEVKSDDNGRINIEPNIYSWAEDGTALKFLQTCGKQLKRIQFSGGEPLLSQDHLNILRHLVTQGRSSQMTLDYNTNLTVLPNEIIDLWTNFKQVYIGVSIDGPPEVNEYIRFPAKTTNIIHNLKKLDASDVQGHFWVCPTIQIYNIFSLIEMETWWAALDLKRFNKNLSWHILRAPKELSIYALPSETKDKVCQLLQSSNQFNKISKAIYEEDFSEKFAEFFQTTKTMDNYRQQSIKKISRLWVEISEYEHFSSRGGDVR
jgi:pyruvate-formate lyase-activating enzyme